MPRLSIIVPHVSNEAALESTLLSLLENRPANVEIIVAHSDDYADPYGLDADEVRIVTGPSSRDTIELINAGLEYASAPIVQTLLPGSRVTHDWTVSALAWFHDLKIGSVGAVGEIEDSNHGEFCGLDVRCLPRRMRSSKAKRGDQAGTSLCGGFYRRDVIESLGGWMEGSTREGAEVEAALAMQALGLKSIVEPASRICGRRDVIEGEMGGYANGHFSAQLAMAYSTRPGSTLFRIHWQRVSDI